MTALQWLNDIFQWVGRFFPRLTMVPPTHRGVLFGPRGGTRLRGPGVVVWWPMIYQLVTIPVTTQSITICARSMPVGGAAGRQPLIPRVIACGLAVQYRVVDAVKAATNVLSLHALIDNRCQSAIGRHWTTLGEAHRAVERASKEMSPWLLEQYGVELERVDVTHLGEAVCLMQLNDYGWNDDASGVARSSASNSSGAE